MRVAIISNSFDDHGGAGRIASMQAREFLAQGYEVKSWTADSELQVTSDESQVGNGEYSGINGRATIELSSTRYDFNNLKTYSAFKRLLFHLYDLQPNMEIVREVVDFKPDLLITHNLTGCGWGTAEEIKATGVKWNHTLHDVQMFEPSGQIFYDEKFVFLRKLWRRFWAWRRRKVFGEPDKVVSPTQWLVDEHRKYGLFKDIEVEIRPNEVEVAKDTTAERENIFLYVGRLDYAKGYDIVLDAWMGLPEKPGKLVVIGDGPLKNPKHDSSVELLGALPNEEVRNWMLKSKVVLFASRLLENQPTVLLEAMAAGCDVIAHDVGGVRETLGGYGVLVKAGDIRNWELRITNYGITNKE